MTISIIVALAKNRAIGKGNELLWHISEDLKGFKTTTMGKPIIMGRKTYESIGRPLPGRRNLVISRTENLKIEGVECYTSLDLAFASCTEEDEVFVIGGGQIYDQTINIADKLYLTVVHKEYEADTFFPMIDPMTWEEDSFEEYDNGAKFEYPFSFVNYSRRER